MPSDLGMKSELEGEDEPLGTVVYSIGTPSIKEYHWRRGARKGREVLLLLLLLLLLFYLGFSIFLLCGPLETEYDHLDPADPRQLHLQMEGMDRPKVGEWRDTKGFYGASIPLAWAQDPRRDVILTFKMTPRKVVHFWMETGDAFFFWIACGDWRWVYPSESPSLRRSILSCWAQEW